MHRQLGLLIMEVNNEIILKLLTHSDKNWQAPEITDTDSIPTGDMPGDKIDIKHIHKQKANVIFPVLLQKLQDDLRGGKQKAVIAVHGGSGVGKSETGALLSYYFNSLGIGSYVLSGDNYPRRMPEANDAERKRVFKVSGLKGLIEQREIYNKARGALEKLWREETDADLALAEKYTWLKVYHQAGRAGLEKYLGGYEEIDFDEINGIIKQFKEGKETIMLKRMGRVIEDLWYDAVDFSDKNILIIEWTHGNNPNLEGIDLAVLLNSTPEETLAHRIARNRDRNLDSPFTTMVLNIEQEKLKARAHTAAIIVTKDARIISYDEYLKLMEEK